MTPRRTLASSGLLARALRWWLGLPPPEQADEESLTPPAGNLAPNDALTAQARLDAVLQQLDALTERLSAQVTASSTTGDATETQAALRALERQLSRVGREQLRANALMEAQTERLDALLEAVRAAESRRQADQEWPREKVSSAQPAAAAPLEVVRSILPALDGLDEALRAGQQILATSDTAPEAPPRSGLLRWRKTSPPADAEPLREAMASWLTGLDFVRQRLLDALAAEGVRPIEAQGNPFDPDYHEAIETTPPDEEFPPGTVAAELRRGYLVDGRVLRHAEVAVTREGIARNV